MFVHRADPTETRPTSPDDVTLAISPGAGNGHHVTRSRTKVLFVYTQMASFMQKDLAALTRHFDVVSADCGTPGQTIQNLRLVAECDLVFCWFGSLRYLPVVSRAWMLGKPIVVVCGGYDVANLPSIGYGNMTRAATRWPGRLLFKMASKVLSFSEFSRREALENARVDARKLETLYLGFAPEEIPEPHGGKQNVVLTIGFANSSSIHRKGILTVARVSRKLPDVAFVIAGRCDAEAERILRAESGPNVQLVGYVDSAALQAWYERANVYLQPSLHEGFGCAVAEAMLAGCQPIVSRNGSLAEVAGTMGVYVDPDDLTGIAAAIRNSLANPPFEPQQLRRRILEQFPSRARNERLVQILRSLIDRPGSAVTRSQPQSAAEGRVEFVRSAGFLR